MARSMASWMHSSCTALRRKHSMNIRQVFEAKRPDDDVLGDLQRIMQTWAEARARFGGGGDLLFGDFGAADNMFAPVVTRIATSQLPVPRFAPASQPAVLENDLTDGG